jgi:hypothetical protein
MWKLSCGFHIKAQNSQLILFNFKINRIDLRLLLMMVVIHLQMIL